MLGVRLALVTLAFVACAWFALGIRSVNDQQAVSGILSHFSSAFPAQPKSSVLPAQQETQALSELKSAAVLDPDGEIDILRAHVLLDAGHPGRAKQVLLALVAHEPKNIDAWTLLYLSPPPHNSDSNLAATRIDELAPPVPIAR